MEAATHIILINSLQEKVVLLKDFLEGYDIKPGNEIEALEDRIASITYVAQDAIELYIVDDILAQSPEKKGEYNLMEKTCLCLRNIWEAAITVVGRSNTPDQFSRSLQEVIQEMSFIMKALIVMEKSKLNNQHDLNNDVNLVSSSLLRNSDNRKDTLVGFDNELPQMIDELVRQAVRDLKVISITGMGGIGKTTLAKYLHDSPHIVKHFDRRAFFTISQEYNVIEMLLSLLQEVGPKQERDEYHQLGKRLYQCLFGRRYFLVLDDMWSIKAWEDLKPFLPDNHNGSRILVTTRLLDVANNFGSLHEMNLLDDKESWRLLRQKVFDEKDCPCELEEIGKKIARLCKGLPLSIAVMGGLLAKSRLTPNDWEFYAENINTTLTSENDEYCLRILSLSYKHLPIHLKPCFLYMGVFPEDDRIRVSELIKLWIAEGFLKPIEMKSLEDTAKEYLKDLVDRHLVILVERGSSGGMKTCGVHDLLRNLCLSEAHKRRFLYVANSHSTPESGISNNERRVVLDKSWHHQSDCVTFQTTELSCIRSITCNYVVTSSIQPLSLRLTRVFNWEKVDSDTAKILLEHVNYRYLKYTHAFNLSPVHQLWNLQTLNVRRFFSMKTIPLQIWEMPQLRHVMIDGISLPNPDHGDNVLKNLHTLSSIRVFKFSRSTTNRIPNVKKLRIVYKVGDLKTDKGGWKNYYLGNIRCLDKLQSLSCTILYSHDFLMHVQFPNSLRKLTLRSNIRWEDVTKKIGSLPNLEKLTLDTYRSGRSWTTVDEEFVQLKVLRIHGSRGLIEWITDDAHFPSLERLSFIEVYGLQMIPSCIGDIATLQSIELVNCNDLLVGSARRILHEQQELGNDSLRLMVK